MIKKTKHKQKGWSTWYVCPYNKHGLDVNKSRKSVNQLKQYTFSG